MSLFQEATESWAALAMLGVAIDGSCCFDSVMNEPVADKKNYQTREHILLSSEEEEELERISNDHRLNSDLRVRAQIVLDAAHNIELNETASRVKVSWQTVAKWRRRFKRHRIAGLTTRPTNQARARLSQTLEIMKDGGGAATPADVKRAIVAFITELPDDDRKAPHAPRAKVKLGALTLLARITANESKNGNVDESETTLALLESLRDEADAMPEPPKKPEPPTLEQIVYDLEK